MLPVPSSFELPPEYRNRFERVDELRRWRLLRGALRLLALLCFLALILPVIVSYLGISPLSWLFWRRNTGWRRAPLRV